MVAACSFGLPLGPRPSTHTGSLPLSRDGRSCRMRQACWVQLQARSANTSSIPSVARDLRAHAPFESGALAAFNAMSFNSSLLCPRTLGSDAPSRTADIRLCTSVTVVCRPVPMLYPGRFDGRATGAHKGLDVEIVMGGSAVPVHREGPAGDHGAACALSPRGGNDRWISCSINRVRHQPRFSGATTRGHPCEARLANSPDI
jgi:hypothetical protein